jgi:membrane protease subunit HflK
MYLETMERVLGGTDKIILDSGGASASGGSGVVPYLPLNELMRPITPPSSGSAPQSGSRQ